MNDDWLWISRVVAYGYCKRLFYLQTRYGFDCENEWIVRGHMFHRGDDSYGESYRNGVRTYTALPVFDETLRVYGRCDAVEVHKDGSVTVVERKSGRSVHDGDKWQVVLQGMCLESSGLFDGDISCCVRLISSRRRVEIPFSEELQRDVKTVLNEMREVMSLETPPVPKRCSGCTACSLRDVCGLSLRCSDGFWRNVLSEEEVGVDVLEAFVANF